MRAAAAQARIKAQRGAGRTTSWTNAIRVSADTSSMRRRRIRSIPRTLFAAASDDRLGSAPATFILFRAADISFVDFDLATDIISSRTHHGAPQLVQPSPDGLIAIKPNSLWRPSALTPFFWLVTNHIARNHSRNDSHVSWKPVPAVKVCSICRSDTGTGLVTWSSEGDTHALLFIAMPVVQDARDRGGELGRDGSVR
jgi:hypothetical protein